MSLRGRSSSADLRAAWSRGSLRQRAAEETLRHTEVLERLAPWNATLAGTFPLDLDIDGSDLDVLVEVEDPDAYETQLRTLFGDRFALRFSHLPGPPVALVARFGSTGVPVEVFAQNVPVEQQVAHRHLVVEARCLERGGKTLRREVRALKEVGRSTEQAFAEVLGLEGDPVRAVLSLEGWSDQRLDARLSRPASPRLD